MMQMEIYFTDITKKLFEIFDYDKNKVLNETEILSFNTIIFNVNLTFNNQKKDVLLHAMNFEEYETK